MATQKINGVYHVSNTQQGGGGGSDPEAVKYTPQTLTEAQKTQARTNIGAADEINGITSATATVDNTSGTPAVSVSLNNQQLSLAFSGLKGAQGNTGSSVDYPYELVNNVTTDDATKGLSAAQGVVLQGEIDQLGQEVTDIDASLALTRDTEPVETITPNGYWGNNGIYYKSNNYRTTIPIAVSYGDALFVRAATVIGIVTKVDSDGTFIETLLVGEADIKDYYITIDFFGFIAISYRTADGPLYRIIKGEKITDLAKYLDFGWKNITPTAQEENGYWGPNGTFYQSSSYRTSLPISVSNGDKLKVFARGAVSMVTKVSPGGAYIATLLTGTNTFEQHEINIDFNGLIAFSWNNSYRIIVDVLSTRFRKDNTGKLQGISWGAMGDSYTDPSTLSGQIDNRNYVDLIVEETGVVCANYGVSGSGYKRLEDANKAFYQKALTISPNCDVVTIFGSGNDQNWSSLAEVGEATDTGTTTLCGCINTTIDNLLSVNPLFRIGLITPTPWRGYPPFSTTATWMARYSAKIVEIANLRGLPYLDLYHKSNLRPWDDSVLSALYIDSTHPNTEGHKRIASMIKAFLIEVAG